MRAVTVDEWRLVMSEGPSHTRLLSGEVPRGVSRATTLFGRAVYGINNILNLSAQS
jgi:hypothetical protein